MKSSRVQKSTSGIVRFRKQVNNKIQALLITCNKFWYLNLVCKLKTKLKNITHFLGGHQYISFSTFETKMSLCCTPHYFTALYSCLWHCISYHLQMLIANKQSLEILFPFLSPTQTWVWLSSLSQTNSWKNTSPRHSCMHVHIHR